MTPVRNGKTGFPKQNKKKTEDKETQTKKTKSSVSALCIRCGNTTDSNFYKSNDQFHKFTSKLPYCKKCIKDIFLHYSRMFHDYNIGTYYMCRKIDIPYVHNNYLTALERLGTEITEENYGDFVSFYIRGLTFADVNGWGTSFDDSIGVSSIESLDVIDDITKIQRKINANSRSSETQDEDDYEIIECDTSVLQSKWGQTFDNWELAYLEGEYLDWEEKLNGITDKSIDILVKQICYQLLDIFKERQAGNSVDKKLSTLTSLMNSSGLIEKQNQANANSKSLGMTIADIETKRPATSGKAIFDDVDGVRDYIFGSAGCFFKASGIENEYTRFYDKWMADYSVPMINDMIEEKRKENEAANGE